MKFAEVCSHLTGLSCPIFGASWNPPEPQRVSARRVLAFLEDRRVLYSPSEMEVPQHCVDSVLKIREFLTAEIGKLETTNDLAQTLRAMRAACRKFLALTDGPRGNEVLRFGAHPNHWANWEFGSSLGEMRGVFGIQIARLAASHGLDVEDDLGAILPAEDRDSGWTMGSMAERPA